ncbi:oligopeptide/dipeptide ABC transporter ATP-binding protein [Haloarculaceae archaeon H-GB2-1]|nr:oligopeptide/dipeptide ABC transporter ATP-binding protein [Haloarculaceae archaeon H-GB2-1]
MEFRSVSARTFGGQQQRVLIALALACQPQFLILDEPTTGLDMTTQTKILDLIESLIEQRNTSVMLISHNLGVLAQIADRVGIMYAGEIIERGTTTEIFRSPANPYTQGLLASLPQQDKRKLKPIPGQIGDLRSIPDGCIFADRCDLAEEACRTGEIGDEKVTADESHYVKCRRWETALEDPIGEGLVQKSKTRSSSSETLLSVRDLRKYFDEESIIDRFFGSEPPVKAVDGVSFDVNRSETLAIVGESGCGKSTLGSCLLDLLPPTGGAVTYRGREVTEMTPTEKADFRSECQIVFQNPHSSLNPRKTVGQSIKRPLEMFTEMDETEQRARIAELLNDVGLDPSYADDHPSDLSGVKSSGSLSLGPSRSTRR